MESFKLIKSNKGYYIYPFKVNYLYNMKEAEKTFNSYWGFIEDYPKSIGYYTSGGYSNEIYEIKDELLISDKYPKIIPAVYNKDEYEYSFPEQYNYLNSLSLYNFKRDKMPDIYNPVEFEVKVILEVEEINEPPKISLNALMDYNKNYTINNDNIIHQELDKILFPSLLIHNCECELSSKHSYDIVRAFIKENINGKFAEITSDYNFCFTVKKKIELETPESFEYNINTELFSKRKKKPEYVTKYRKDRLIEIFEMTYSPENYKGYTPIKGFSGKNEFELENNIKEYLKNLITKINAPLKDCPNCHGYGVINKDTEKNVDISNKIYYI